MKKIFLLSVLIACWCRYTSAQTDREFWFVGPEVTVNHYDNHWYAEFNKTYRGGEPIMLRITSLDKAASVIITSPAQAGFDTIRVTVPAKSVRSLNLTDLRGNLMIENTYGTNGFNNKAIHIESSEIITAYYEVYTTNNTDLFSLKGKNAMGTLFYCPFQTIAENHDFSAFASAFRPAYHAAHIVATKDNTEIWITPTKNVQGSPVHPANVPYMIRLNKGETYSVCPEGFKASINNRLAGTKIESNYPIAVTVSDDSEQLAQNGCYDLLGDQLIPVSLLGTEYIALKGQISMSGRAAGKTGEQLYVVATQNNTSIYINGNFKITINEQGTYFYEFGTTEEVIHVRANKPVYVLHVSGFGCEMGEAILPPTSKCTGSWQVGFTRSTSAGFFLNLMVRKEGYADFTLNGTPILTNLTDWKTVPGDANWLAARVDYTANTALVPVQAQSIIENKVGIFHVGVINGTKYGGCRYGYFSDFNELKIEAITINTESSNIRICHGETVRLEAYGGSNFKWSPSLYLDRDDIQRPVSKPKTSTLYTVVTSGLCGMKDSAKVNIEVMPRVEALFTLDTSQACAPHTFEILNSSSGATKIQKWNFGDGSPEVNNFGSTLSHTYRNTLDTAVTKTMSLVVANNEGCRDTMSREILLYPEVNASFTASDTIACHPLVTQFTNTSTGANDTLPPYIWDFGDGGASSTTTSPSHSFFNKTHDDLTYQVRLVSRNMYLCNDTAYKTMVVHPHISANFQFSPDESCNPYNMTISNTTVGADTYQWKFGDGQTSTSPLLLFTHLYNNSTTATKVYSIELDAANAEGCKDTARRQVTVHPTLDASFTPSARVGCDSLVVTFTNKSTGGSSYKWEFGDGASSTLASPSHVFRNLTGSDITFTVKLTVAASNMFCLDTISTTIVVHPYLKSSFNFSPSEVCSPALVTINNTSVGLDSYSWTFGDGQSSTSPAASMTHLYTNATTLPVTYSLKLVGTNTEGCSSTITRLIKAYPPIDASFTQSKNTVCDSVLVSFSNTSTGAATYSWDFGDGSSSSLASPTHVYRNLGTTNKIYTIRLIAQSSNLLCADTITSTITVYPYVKSGFTFDPKAGCSPFVVTVTNNASGANTINWDFGNGQTSTSTASSFSHTYVNNSSSTKTYTLNQTVTNAAGCVSTTSKTVTAYPKVSAKFAVKSGCEPLDITNFNNTSTNASIYEWTFGDGASSNLKSPSHTFRNLSLMVDSTYSVSLRASSSTGCSARYDTTVKVFPKPFADFSLSDPSGCSPYTFSVTHGSQGQSAVTWDFGDGSARQNWNVKNFDVSYTNNSTSIKNYTILLIATNAGGCSDTLSRSVSIYPKITSSFSVVSGCSPLVIDGTTFANTSLGAAEYKWTFGDGTESNEQNPTHAFANFNPAKDTTFTVTLKNTSFTGCQASSSKTLTVYAKPQANFNVTDANGCSPYSVTIANSSKGAASYDWNFGDGKTHGTSTSSQFSYLYYNTTSSIKNNTITLIASSAKGCSDTIANNVVIYPNITSKFSIKSGCEPLIINNFNNKSVGALEYSWNFGDGTSSSVASPSHEFNNQSYTRDTTFKITLKTTRYECSATSDTTITIYHKPLAEFLITNPEGCSPHTSNITNLAQGFSTLEWKFGDNSATANTTSSTLTHTYANSSGVDKTFPLRLIARTASGCSDTMTRNTVVHSQVTANFSAFSGCHPLQIDSFKNTSVGANTYSWTYGDGTSSNNVDTAHTFNNFTNVNKTFTISLLAQSSFGCSGTHDTVITVYPLPLADFNINNTVICTPDSSIFRNSSSGADTLLWNFGDGSAIVSSKPTAALLYHTYKNATGSTLSFTTIQTAKTKYGCVDTAARTTKINSDITAKFWLTGGCSPLTVSNFHNTSFDADFYNWTFGDGTSSNLANPTKTWTNTSNTFDSTYTISLVTKSKEGCSARMDTIIAVRHLPRADFLIVNPQGCSPALVSFKNNASGVDTLLWNFGDGSAVLRNPAAPITHVYNNNTGASRTYATTQTAITRYGCTSKITRNSTINSNITADFRVTGGCSPLVVTDFRNTSFDADQWAWDFGDGVTSNLQNPSHTFVNPSNTTNKTFTVKLTTKSVEGCTASKDTILTVHPVPRADFLIKNPVGCSPFIVNFQNDAVGADTLLWNYGDGSPIDSTQNKTFGHQYRNHTGANIVFTTTQTAKSRYGCTDQVTHASTIRSDISAVFSIKDGCHPLAVTDFQNTSFDADFNDWTFGDGTSSNVKNPTKTFTNSSNTSDSTYTISLVTRSVEGCSARKDTVITIHPMPKANFLVANPVGCSPYAVTFDNDAVGADLLQWNFGDGSPVDSSMSRTVSHLYNNHSGSTQAFTITQTVKTRHGCTDKVSHDATIKSDIVANFRISDGCHPLEVNNFNNTSFDADQWIWAFGDGVTSNLQHPSHVFTNTSNTIDKKYTVSLEVKSNEGCSAKKDTVITIHPVPRADFLIRTPVGCSPFPVSFKNDASGADTLLWDFGDGSPIDSSKNATLVHTYNNNTGSNIVFTTTQTAKNRHGCIDTAQNKATIKSNIVARFRVEDGCHPLVINNFQNTSFDADEWAWSFGDSVKSNQQNPTHTFTNSSNTTDKKYTVSLVIKSQEGCSARKDTVVTVHPVPRADFLITNPEGCSPHAVTFKNDALGADTLLWNFGDGSPIDSSLAKTLVHQYRNHTGALQLFTTIQTAKTRFGCSSSASRDSRIKSDISAEFVIKDGCHPLDVTDFSNTSFNANSYEWSFGDGTSSSLKNPRKLFTNTSNLSDSTYKISLVTLSSENCSARKDTVITIHPAPHADFIINNPVGCSPRAITFMNNSVGANSLLWYFGDGNPVDSSMADSVVHFFSNHSHSTRTFTTILTAFTRFGCSDTAMRSLNLYPDITSEFKIQSGCAPLIVNDFLNTSFGADSWEWSFGDSISSNLQHPKYQFVNTNRTTDKKYTIKLTTKWKESGCSATSDTVITVFHLPLADFNINNPEGCSPYKVSFDNDATGADIVLWNFGDNSPVTSSLDDLLTHEYRNHSGNTIIFTTTQTAKTNDGCLDTASHKSKIHSDVSAEFKIASGCHPHMIQNFLNTSFNAKQWSWNFGDSVTSNEQYPTHLFSNLSKTTDATFKVTLTTTSDANCPATYDTTITVFHKPLVDFSVNNTPGCSPYRATFTNRTKGASILTWNFGDGSPTDTVLAKTHSHVFQNPGPALVNFPVTLLALTPQACSDTLTLEAGIYPDISASFKVHGGCHPVSITNFHNTSTGASSWAWNFDDGETSNLRHPTHVFRNFSKISDSVYHVTLDATSEYGCKAKADTTISVYHNPQANFTVLNTPQCAPATIKFKNISLGMDSCLWYFGDDTMIDTTNVGALSHNYDNRTSDIINYTIKLKTITPQGCVDSTSHTATLYPFVKSRFSTLLQGCSPLDVHFTNTSTGAYKNEWYFGDGNSSNNTHPDHTYYNYSNLVDSVQTVVHRATSTWGCTDTSSTIITVFANPEAQFVVENSPICSPGSLQLTNSSIGADTVFWNFGDGQVSSDSGIARLSHPYVNADSTFKKVTLVMITKTHHECSDTASRTALIYPNIKSSFTADSIGCAPLVSHFTNMSIGAFETFWNFDDGNESSLREPTHTFYNFSNLVDSHHVARLITRSKWGCTDTSRLNITVYANPLARFTINNSPICSPDSIRLTNLSVGTDSLFWNFDDGLTSSGTKYGSFAHGYRNHDSVVHSHAIKLWVQNRNGCADSVTHRATVYPDITSEFTTDSVGCHPLVSQFVNTSFGAHQYQWDFGDGNKANSAAPTHEFKNLSYTVDSVQTVSLLTSSRWGCTAFSSKEFIIFPNPRALFTVLNPTICSPDSIHIENNSIGSTFFDWSFDDGSTISNTDMQPFSHYYRNSDSSVHKHTVRLITTTSKNCLDTISHDVFVYPDINASFTVNDRGCTPLVSRFENLSTGVYQSVWDFGDNTKSSLHSPVHTYINNSHLADSVHHVVLTTISEWGCTDSASIVITAYPNPLAQFFINNSPICSPDTIHLTNLSQGADSIFWDFDDGKDTSAPGGKSFSHFYNNPRDLFDTRTIQLRTFTHHGCSDTTQQKAIVYPNITATFKTKMAGCSPLTIAPSNTSTGASTYFWDFKDGNTTNLKEPSHTYFNRSYSSNLTFKLSLQTMSRYGCTASSDTLITVYPNPVAEFAVPTSASCSPFSVHLSNLSKGASSYLWTFNDGLSSPESAPSFSHTYYNTSGLTKQHEITLVASTKFQCTDTIKHTITTFPEVQAAFSGPFTGCEPLEVPFNNQSLYGNLYFWDFGDGTSTSIKNPTHFYTNPINRDTTYKAQLIVKSAFNCLDTTSQTITVYPQPDADFDVNPKFQVFPRSEIGKATVSVTDLTSPGSWMYSWNMGDSTLLETQGNFSHDYRSWNKSGKYYTIKLLVKNEHGCFDTASQRVTITTPRPEPRFDVNNLNGCPPLNVTFTNNTAYANSYWWNFGDGFKSADKNPTHSYDIPGTYNVTMVVEGDGGKDTTQIKITVFRTPEARFSLSGSIMNVTDSIHTKNNSSYASIYEWDFGDGTVVQGFEPSHKFREAGIYTVKHTAISTEGCKDDTVAFNAINVLAPCGIEFPNAFTPNTAGPSINGRYFGLEATNDIFFPGKLEKGIDKYQLEIFDKWGEIIFSTTDKEVGWDGYYRGVLSKLDVYVWKCKATCVDGSKINLVGDVTLLR